ncbi:winged helix-turn-helix transcriptional regulator [Pectinatus brassicae]
MNDKCQKYDVCPMILVQELLSGKRKILILWYLSYKTLRFSEIKRKLPDVTQRMLTLQLRSLEEDGLINRKIYPVMPPKVEYSLSKKGKCIIPILEMMHKFGVKYLEEQVQSDKAE